VLISLRIGLQIERKQIRCDLYFFVHQIYTVLSVGGRYGRKHILRLSVYLYNI